MARRASAHYLRCRTRAVKLVDWCRNDAARSNKRTCLGCSDCNDWSLRSRPAADKRGSAVAIYGKPGCSTGTAGVLLCISRVSHLSPLENLLLPYGCACPQILLDCMGLHHTLPYFLFSQFCPSLPPLDHIP